MTLNLGFLASHSGTNMQAIIDSVKSKNLDANLCCVISNNSSSGALEKAKAAGIPAFHISEKTHPAYVSEKIIELFCMHGVDTIVLAGYMKILDSKVINAFSGRVLNIHPALLPKYGGEGMYGINVHQAVLVAGEKQSGASIHLVDAAYDRGRVLTQAIVPVEPADTPETLASRVLIAEHKLYSETLQKIATGEIVIP